MIAKNFLRLNDLMHSFRGSGTSTLIKKISETEDVEIISADIKSDLHLFGSEKSTPLSSIRSGMKPKPLLFDNYTIMKLCDDFFAAERQHEKFLMAEQDLRVKATDERDRMGYKLTRMHNRNLWQRIINKKV